MLRGHSLFLSGSTQAPAIARLFIMLSGLPCTGKSTWRTLMVKTLEEKHHMTVSVISADDIAYQIRDEYNQMRESDSQITYSDVCNQYRSELENRYKNAIIAAKKSGGIVILDRTYLESRWRKADLDLIKPDFTYLLLFDIQDECGWRENLKRRNEKNPEKIITDDVIKQLTQGATPPALEEGFLSVTKCSAIGEPGWVEKFNIAIDYFINIYYSISDRQSCSASIEMKFQ